MQDRLNLFEPQAFPATHENQLTRALLLVLRSCPMAHQVWVSLIDPTLPLHSLPAPTFDTQRGKILRSDTQPATNEPIRGISVICAGDATNNAAGVVLESDREMVLDGIIRYGDEVVIVLESKLGWLGDEHQARNINLHGQPIRFDDQIRRILWRDVLAAFTDLVRQDRNLVSGAERIVLADFLDFVDRNFPRLGPFNTLRRCEAEPSRVKRRLHAILSEVIGSDGVTLPGTHTAVSTAYLAYADEEREIRLRMYPADTLQQARVFYNLRGDRPSVVQQVLMLEGKGWRIAPNFHFGHAARGYVWTTVRRPLAEYMSYWQKNIRNTGRVERSGWNEYWDKLVRLKITEQGNREEFDRHFTNTNRETADPRPGIECMFVWRLDEAERLDDQGQLTKEVKKRINQLLKALGEQIINEP